jgi:hypothetical protein
MKNKYQGGFVEGLIIALGLVAIFLLFILPKAPLGPTNGSGSLPSLLGGFSGSNNNNSNTNPDSTNQPNLVKNSSYSNSISLGTGNASYSNQPVEEYITLTNNSNSSINISGWKLQNAKGNRTYTIGNNIQHFTSDTISIPQATNILSPSGSNSFTNVVLKPSDTAVITTGSIGVITPYKIVSFRETECTGYLQSLQDYSFTPSLNQTCVQPRNEQGVANLDTSCQDYIKNMSSCHTPRFNTVDSYGHTVDSKGNTCNNCVDGNNSLSSSCVAFIQQHYNYPGCIAYHQNDSNFYSNEWRIFLGQQWELWAPSYETISVLDSLGKLVNYQSY